ncbi:UNVERIFIED_CONTAM: Vesicle transport v-SNARE 13 [Sesamum latifolium]|uniref:Vesicle transport v-SNARE 13 n=1 Tax=Sesamum latifolium TaxID=2727402 RepID=A0AAW2X8Q0_9LAMI
MVKLAVALSLMEMVLFHQMRPQHEDVHSSVLFIFPNHIRVVVVLLVGYDERGIRKLRAPVLRALCELSKKTSSVSNLDGEQQKQKIAEVRGGLDEAEALIRKMDLEARGLQPNIKAVLLAKLREYKSDLNNLKNEVKRIASTNLNQAARDELLEAGMGDTLTASANQRDRLLMSTERLNNSGNRIRESRKVMLETEELGVSLLQDLHQQRQSLLHANNMKVHATVITSGLLDLPQTFLRNVILHMYAACGDVLAARKLFDEIPITQKDTVDWTTLMDCYSRGGLSVDALSLFVSMRREGVLVDDITMVSVFSTCSKVGNSVFGIQVHACMIKMGLNFCVKPGNAAMDMYAKCGLMGDAKTLFDEMTGRNVVSWTVLLWVR